MTRAWSPKPHNRLARIILIVFGLELVAFAPAWAQYHRIPQYTVATLSANPPIGAQAIVTDGPCKNTLLQGDGVTWRTTAELEQKIINPVCPPYNAKLDNVTDDAAAWNGVFATVTSNGFRIVMPCGISKVTSSIELPSNTTWTLEGCANQNTSTIGSTITGNIAGDLIHAAGVQQIVIRRMQLINSNTSPSSNVMNLVSGTSSSAMYDVIIGSNGASGLKHTTGLTPFSLFNVNFRGSGNIGIACLCRGVYFHGGDVVGWDEGFRLSGTGAAVIGTRFEVNKKGLRLGVDSTGANVALSRAMIAGSEMEANDTAIEIQSLSASTISGITHQGSVNSPSGQSLYGINVVGSTSNVVFSAIEMTGTYSKAAWVTGTTGRTTILNSTASNGLATGKVWDVVNDLAGVVFDGTNFTPRHDDTVVDGSSRRFGQFQYLAAVDAVFANVEGKNLRHKALTVTAASTSLAVLFTINLSGSQNINTATASAGAGLSDGTYFYTSTAVTMRGETSAGPEKTVTLGAGNNQTTIVFSTGIGASGQPFLRRVYRGTVTGIYDGYYETPLNSNANFIDTGAAFARRRSPPPGSHNDSDMREPDANYNVFAIPDWNTTVWVTGKSTTGYTLNFGTAAPGGGGHVDTFYVR